MSGFDLFPAEAATKLESGRAVDLNAGAGVFEGAATAPFTGLAAGATGFARTVNLGMTPIAAAVDQALGTNTRDWWLENMMLERTARRFTPNPREVGVAGQILHSLFDVGGQAVAAGPAGVLVAQTIEKSMQGIEQGLDVGTAMRKGAIEGGSAALGVALPIAMPYVVGSRIPGLVQQLGYGVAANVPLGIASRGLTHKVLADAGYADMAEQYKALDETGLMTDFVLGSAFGALGHAITAKGAKLPVIRPADIDAALAKRNAYHLEVDTAPGLARNGETRDAHVDAVLKATEDLMAGKPVDVGAELRATDFHPMPALEQARTELAQSTAEVAQPIIEAQAETRAITEPAAPSRPVGEVERSLRAHFEEDPGKAAHVAIGETGEVLAWSTSKKRLADELEATKEQAVRVQRVTAALLEKLLPKPNQELGGGKAEPLGGSIEPARAQRIEQALKGEGVDASRENVETVHAIARAREIDAAAVDAIPENVTDAEYLAKVKGIIDDHEKTQAAAANREVAAGEAARAGGGEARGQGEGTGGPAREAAAGGEGAGRVEPLTLEHPAVRTELEHMAKEAGWAEVGGRLIRIKHSEVAGDETISRTKWIPKAEWWPGRPGKLNEAQTAEAVRKALAGEKLSKREQHAIDYMVEVSNERISQKAEIGAEEVAALGEDLRAAELEPTHGNVVDVDLVTRASEIDEGAVERAAAQYENDDHAFLAAIQKIIDDHEAAKGAQALGGGEAGARAPAQGEGRPDLDLASQTEADLRAKEAQAATGNVEERSAALRDRNDAVLTSPEGTAPARSVADARVPTQQEGLFGADMRAVVEAELRGAEEIVRDAPDMLVPAEDGTLVPAEALFMKMDEDIAAAEANAKAFDAAVRCATRAGG